MKLAISRKKRGGIITTSAFRHRGQWGAPDYFPEIPPTADISSELTTDILQVAEYTLHAVIDNTTEGIWVIDADGNTLLANKRMAALLDIDNLMLAKQAVSQLLETHYSTLLLTPIPASGRSQHDIAIETSEGIRWLRITALPRYQTDEAYNGSILICADITTEYQPYISPLTHISPSTRDSSKPTTTGAIPTATSDNFMEQRLRRAQLLSTGPLLAELLSAREIKVVSRLLDGDRVPAIATAMFVTQSTVRNQLASVYRKLGIRSQQELIDLLRPILH